MTELLVSDFITGLMIFIRIGAMLTVVPFYNSNSIPALVRLALSLIITYMIFFNVEAYPFKVDDSLALLFIFGFKEVFVGVIMGFTLNIVFQGISFAGLLVGRDMGLAMSSMFDPVSGDDGNIVATILSMAAVIVFILINGHHFVVQSLSYSFTVIPIGGFAVTESAYELIVKYSGSIFVLSVKIASPLIVAYFLIHLASGIIARVSPSFQVFFVLIPLKIGVGLFLLVLVMPLYIYLFRDLMYEYEGKLFEILKVLSN
jgi:flagellar biosynthesis protein FliR